MTVIKGDESEDRGSQEVASYSFWDKLGRILNFIIGTLALARLIALVIGFGSVAFDSCREIGEDLATYIFE